MRNTPNSVRQKLALLPETPGVYLMKDDHGEIIYIGKAKVLRNRVRSYFVEGAKEHRAAALLAPLVSDIEWIITETEWDALLLEARLIQKQLPRLNVRLKDGKRYPYLKVTTREPFPRIVEVRRVVADGNRYFGPYVDSRAMRRVVELIQRLFKIRSCRLKLPSKKEERVCLAYHIGRCDAPCVHLCTEEEYAEGVRRAIQLLSGRLGSLSKELRAAMNAAAEEHRFEQAARLRDQIAAIEVMGERQLLEWSGTKSDLDVVVVRRSGTVAVLVILEYREGALTDRRQIELRSPMEQSEEELFLDALIALGPRTSARLLLLERMPEDIELVEKWLSTHAKRRVRIAVPQRGMRLDLVKMAALNAETLISQSEALWELEEKIPLPLVELQRLLQLPAPPQTIVGFDISHLGGTGTVASMVVFENGRPRKGEYRKFRIENVEGVDDYASMREVVGRRARRIVEEGLRWPDLILIDGGEGQLSSAWEALRSAGAPEDLQVIGLAEREEQIVLSHHRGRLVLNPRNPAQKLLQQIRDEAHRFAITFQRKSRERSLHVLEELAEFSGIGPATRKKLSQKWRSFAAVKRASLEDLMALIGQAKGEHLYRLLHPQAAEKNSTES